MSIDELLMAIEKLDNEEREKVLTIIKEKYDLTNKLPIDAFFVNSSYDFWLNEDDDIYNEQIGDLKRR